MVWTFFEDALTAASTVIVAVTVIKSTIIFRGYWSEVHALEIFKQELHSDVVNSRAIGTGAMIDPYIQIESRPQLTQGHWSWLISMSLKFNTKTKSSRILRDLDLASIHQSEDKAVGNDFDHSWWELV